MVRSANHFPLMFADGRVFEVSVPFLKQCGTLEMFELIPDIVNDGCMEPVSVPGLEYEQHARLLGIVSALDMHASNVPDGSSVDHIYDLKLGALTVQDLLTLLNAADYLHHQHALGSCVRVIADRLRGKSREEMLQVMGLEESRERSQLADARLDWVLAKNDVPYPW